jgi:hypothetical protein
VLGAAVACAITEADVLHLQVRRDRRGGRRLHAAVSLANGARPTAWLGACAAAMALVALGVAIAVYEGGWQLTRLLGEAVRGNPAGPIGVTVALIGATSVTALPDPDRRGRPVVTGGGPARTVRRTTACPVWWEEAFRCGAGTACRES